MEKWVPTICQNIMQNIGYFVKSHLNWVSTSWLKLCNKFKTHDELKDLKKKQISNFYSIARINTFVKKTVAKWVSSIWQENL